MTDAYIAGGLRSPIGSFGGSLAAVRADDLAAHALQALLAKFPNLDPAALNDVVLGCANQAGEDNRNVARMALLLAGYPHSVPGETVNRLCASGMSAAALCMRAIRAGEGELFVAGGVEHMTRGPWVMSKTSTPYGRDMQLFDSSFGWRFVHPNMEKTYGIDAMGRTAENLLETRSISRQAQDEFALHSQQKAARAQAEGLFEQEIAPISIPQRKGDPIVVGRDEFIKPNTSLEILSQLKPAFKEGGSVTAGNASGLNDGSAALLIGSAEGLNRFQIDPLTRICSSAVAGVEPRIMGIGPVPASQLALKRAGLSLNDMDVIEINEAFAAQVLSVMADLDLDFNDNRVNPNGGAIALGHPLGMSGARLLLTASLELQRRKARYALCTMCIGVGQGYAVVLENVAN